MKQRRQRGSVLIFTLWLTIGLAAAALFFGQSSMLRYRAASNEFATARCTQASDGALRYVTTLLAANTLGTLPDPTAYQAADLVIGDTHVWLLGRGDDPTAATPAFGLQDEAARLNLNVATTDHLSNLPGMTTDLATAIVDWRSTSGSGASAAAYAMMDPPYGPKGTPFESVDELRLVAGAGADLLAGRDRNRNGMLEQWERDYVAPGQTIFSGIPDVGLLDCFTVLSSEPNTTAAAGSARVNLNGTPAAVRATLVTVLGSQRGAAVAAAARVGQTRFTSVLQLCLLGQATDAEAAQLYDHFTMQPGATAIAGHVNVNTASAAVLAAIPGIGTDNAAALVAYRSHNATAFASPLWVGTAIGNEAAITAGPFLTAKSYQVTADIVAVDSQGRGFTRTRYVIDTTTGTPVVVARRDLTYLGWPLGQALHDQYLVNHGVATP